MRHCFYRLMSQFLLQIKLFCIFTFLSKQGHANKSQSLLINKCWAILLSMIYSLLLRRNISIRTTLRKRSQFPVWLPEVWAWANRRSEISEEPVSGPITGSLGVSESEIGNLLSKNQLAEALTMSRTKQKRLFFNPFLRAGFLYQRSSKVTQI